MAYEIIWTDEAIYSFDDRIEYPEINFSKKEIIRFTKATHKKLELIIANPGA